MPTSTKVVSGFVRTETTKQNVVSLSPLKIPVRKARPGFVDIDEVVRERESTGEGRAAMRAARSELASDLLRISGNSLRSLRMSKGLSQSRLAEMIGSTQSHIARIESGRDDVQVSTLLRIARALESEPGQVFAAFIAKFELA